ncbi:MAG: hypothetical protein LBH05_07910 [Deferribacteraceae bacterium]|jgi:hypothetical protein|nr:hypothetical protein [Deferribacteraceae bacterium]
MKKLLIISASVIAVFFVAFFFIANLGLKIKGETDSETSELSYTGETFTIYDIATTEELKHKYGYVDYTKENYPNTNVSVLSRMQTSQEKKEQEFYDSAKKRALGNPDINYAELSCLYAERGDKVKAEKYADKIIDTKRRQYIFEVLDTIYKSNVNSDVADSKFITVFDIATPEELQIFFGKRIITNIRAIYKEIETPIVFSGEAVTVFDIATPEELIKLFRESPSLIYEDEIAFYKDYSLNHPDSNFADLALFYYICGEKVKAYEYINKIRSPNTQNRIIRRIEPSEHGF